MVPLVDLRRRHRRFEEPFVDATRRVLHSGRVLLAKRGIAELVQLQKLTVA